MVLSQSNSGRQEWRWFRLGLSSIVNQHSFSSQWSSQSALSQSDDDDDDDEIVQSINRWPLCDFSSRLSTDGRFRYRQREIFPTSFSPLVRLADSVKLHLVLLSSSMITQKRVTVKNRRATRKLLATYAQLHFQHSNQPRVTTTLSVNRRLLEVARPPDINLSI